MNGKADILETLHFPEIVEEPVIGTQRLISLFGPQIAAAFFRGEGQLTRKGNEFWWEASYGTERISEQNSRNTMVWFE
jgi:hypothetical protein